jgi:hypothetical protein
VSIGLGAKDLVYCRNCGNQLREDAKFCDKCGSTVGKETTSSPIKNEYNLRTEDVVRSTKIYVSQQRLYVVLGSILGGFFFLAMAVIISPMPSMNDPWGPNTDYTFNTIAALMGIGSIIFGIAFYILGEGSQEQY